MIKIPIHTTIRQETYNKLKQRSELERKPMGEIIDDLIERQGYDLNETVQRIFENQQRNIIEIVHRIVI